jgi:pilus assembly protein CpaE
MTAEADYQAVSSAGGASGPVALVPRINIQALCELPETMEVIRTAFADRRMARAHATVAAGGIPEAIRLYQAQSTPSLLMVESTSLRDELLAKLASLAEVCQPDTKVVVLGHANDVVLYRELMRQGVSEYVVAPFAPLQIVEAVASLYRNERAVPVGRVIAFVGAKGGTGSSTIAHNCGWEFARAADTETTIIDLDLAFGTAALNFNVDASGGIMEAIAQPDRVDGLLLDRLLVPLGDKLSLLGGSGGVDTDFLIEAHVIETILVAMRTSVPVIVVDIPNVWAPWVKFTLLHADQIIVTAEPELASLRNAKALVDMLKAARPNDPPPGIVLNKAGVPKRPEISAADFSKAAGIDVVATIPFDPQNFGASLNNGRMLLDMAPRSKAADAVRKLARTLTGDKTKAAARSSLLKRLLGLGKG